jgi:PAS domain S-box-containing protein
MGVHITTYMVIIALYLFRNRLPLQLKFMIIISLFLIIGTTGLISKGIMSNGIFWFIAVGITSMYLIGNRAALIIMAIGMAIMLLTGIFYVTGILTYNFDIKAYITSPYTWILEFFSSILIFALIYASTYRLHNSFLLAINDAKNKEQNLRYIINNTTDGITVLNKEGFILIANNSFGKIMGTPHHKLIGHNIEEYAGNHQLWLYQLRSDKYVGKSKFIKIKNQLNEELELEIESRLIHLNEEEVALMVVRNVSAQKKQQRELMAAIIETEERERSYFAKELHDGIGPILSTTRMYLDLLADDIKFETKPELMHRIQESVEEALQSIKEISNNISPHVLKNFGLASAIQNYSDKNLGLLGLSFHLKNNLKTRLPENIETTFYRISIELINNTLKYAKAKNVSIQLDEKTHTFSYFFTHDGTGFDYQKTIALKKGMGLFNLVQRIISIGGEIFIDTAPDKNLEIFITLEL